MYDLPCKNWFSRRAPLESYLRQKKETFFNRTGRMPGIKYKKNMSVIAKFKVTENRESLCTEDDYPCLTKKGHKITLMAVTCGSAENENFFNLTPFGKIDLAIVNDAAAEQFVVGKECKVIFEFDEQCPEKIIEPVDEKGLARYKNLTFGDAIEALKQGKRASRAGWNGKGMFIFMRPADEIRVDIVANNIKSLPVSVKEYYSQDLLDDDGNLLEIKDDDTVKFTAYLCLKAADGTIVNGWLATQTDILAEDWIILD